MPEPDHFWRTLETLPRWPYAFSGSYLSWCHDMVGGCSSEPTEKQSTALQEGLITYTSCKGKSRTGEKAY